MSGHSKWSTIHRQKEVADAKRGQVFTKLAKAIIVAVSAGGGVTDPEQNFRLRLAIEKAKGFNMPKDNIERAIARGAGRGGGEAIEEVVYEGYGPGGVAVVIEAVTDNRQRTGQMIKNVFDRGGGSLAGPGAVSFQFEKNGLLILSKPQNIEEAILKIIDLGVDDVQEADDALEVYTKLENLEEMRKKIESAGFRVSSFEPVLRPKTVVPIANREQAQKILSFLEKLEEQDDVQKVYANFDIPADLANQMVG